MFSILDLNQRYFMVKNSDDIKLLVELSEKNELSGQLLVIDSVILVTNKNSRLIKYILRQHRRYGLDVIILNNFPKYGIPKLVRYLQDTKLKIITEGINDTQLHQG